MTIIHRFAIKRPGQHLKPKPLNEQLHFITRWLNKSIAMPLDWAYVDPNSSRTKYRTYYSQILVYIRCGINKEACNNCAVLPVVLLRAIGMYEVSYRIRNIDTSISGYVIESYLFPESTSFTRKSKQNGCSVPLRTRPFKNWYATAAMEIETSFASTGYPAPDISYARRPNPDPGTSTGKLSLRRAYFWSISMHHPYRERRILDPQALQSLTMWVITCAAESYDVFSSLSALRRPSIGIYLLSLASVQVLLFECNTSCSLLSP
eukprot:CAMPEP_0178481420 /NCGR_PEP_ID=MMETSP0696-20121128/6205_1 /TAXON_ID=265572 /ORGANISM="Extubocellulus spinifer, Strain CCMP396" /LENGTH=262 /DNA_ID=CAMNT_0020108897 /DNA_START=258 /DNA_END=1046 /DNA_ORIENTATION=+